MRWGKTTELDTVTVTETSLGVLSIFRDRGKTIEFVTGTHTGTYLGALSILLSECQCFFFIV